MGVFSYLSNVSKSANTAMILSDKYSVPVERKSVIYNIIGGLSLASPKNCRPHDLAIMSLATFCSGSEGIPPINEMKRWLVIAKGFKLSGEINTIYGHEAIFNLANIIASRSA